MFRLNYTKRRRTFLGGKSHLDAELKSASFSPVQSFVIVPDAFYSFHEVALKISGMQSHFYFWLPHVRIFLL